MSKTLVLFEDEGFVNLLPLVFWRSIFELQLGRKIVLDRTAQRLGLPVAGVWTRDWLARVAAQRCGAPANQPVADATVLVNGRWLFDDGLEFPKGPCVGVVDCDGSGPLPDGRGTDIAYSGPLPDGRGTAVAYIVCDARLAERLAPGDLLDPARREAALTGVERHPADGRCLRYPWEVTADLSKLLESDWRPAEACIEARLPPKLALENPERIHIGERTKVHPTAIINAAAGPVFISHDVQIAPYVVIEGPAYIGPGSRLHPYTWLHGGNAIGPVCRIAGELHGCVIHGYSNKQHTGFLGRAYVGSWVNIGAGAANSDLKNTYGTVRVPVNGVSVDTGMKFFGAIIGDHAKIGINATIPSGAVIGLAASIASSAVLPKYIPSFSWVTQNTLGEGDPLRLLDAASAAMARRDVDMTDDEVELFLDLGKRVKSYEGKAS